MPLVVFVKLLSELSLFFSAAGFILSFLGLASSLLAVPFIFALSAAVFYLLQNKGSLRYAALILLPVGIALFFGKAIELLLLVPAAAYTAAICISGRIKFDRWQAAAILKKGFLVCIVLCILSVFLNNLTRAQICVVWTVIFCVSSALLCRMLRLDENVWSSPQFIASNLIPTAGLCAIAALLSSDLILGSLGNLGKAFYSKAILPVIKYILNLLSYVVKGATGLLDDVEFHEESMKDFGNKIEASDLDLKYDGELSKGSDILVTVLIIIGIIAFLVIAFLLFRHFMGDRISGKKNDEKIPWGDSSFDGEVKRRSIFAERDSRWHVRETYRKFLVLCKKRGVSIKASSTSTDICSEAAGIFDSDDINALQQIYAPARYSQKAVASADSKKAREHYNRLKNTK